MSARKPRYDKSIYWSKRWRALRLQVFARDGYTCQACGGPCYGTGRGHPEAPECDHIIPHRGDERLKWDMDNLQTLHKRCHSTKTITEDGGMAKGAAFFPDWLPMPACKVVLVCGPPGAGKATWAKAQATAQDVVIDLDDCFTEVCGVHGHDADKDKHIEAAIRLRNKQLADLHNKRSGTAYLIAAAPTDGERKWWCSKLGATVYVIKTTTDEMADRGVSEDRQRAARDWYDAAMMNEWKPGRIKRGLGVWTG